MDRSVAKAFAFAVIGAADKLDQALRDATEGAEQWKQFAGPVGEILGAIYGDVLIPIYREHPGLEREVETKLGNLYP